MSASDLPEYRLLDRGETMQEGDEALAASSEEKWEPVAHWLIGMPFRGTTAPVRRAIDVQMDAESVIERLQAKIEHKNYWYGVRLARLWHWAHEELNEAQKSRYFNIVANGTADHMEQPTYAQQMNALRHRAEAAEKALASLRAYGDKRAREAVPEGWKLVPVEPTEEMLDAGRTAVMARDLSGPNFGPADHYRLGGYSIDGIPARLLEGKHRMSKSHGAALVYAAMLAAAPTPGEKT